MQVHWLWILSIAIVGSAQAETIAIIGTGDVAAALGPEFSAQEHVVVYGSREPNRADVRAQPHSSPSRLSRHTHRRHSRKRVSPRVFPRRDSHSEVQTKPSPTTLGNSENGPPKCGR